MHKNSQQPNTASSLQTSKRNQESKQFPTNKTMKQKMVIKVSMSNHKSRSKALRVAVGFSGVESVALKGDDMSQIEVTGDGVDAVALTTSLRKKVGYAEVVSVVDAGAGDQSVDDKKIEPNPEPVVWPNYHVAVPLPHYDVHVVRDYDPYGCSIL